MNNNRGELIFYVSVNITTAIGFGCLYFKIPNVIPVLLAYILIAIVTVFVVEINSIDKKYP